MSTILAVDDDIVSRLVLKAQLERLGYEVTEAADAPEALELFDPTRVALVISDYEMPSGSGLDLFEQLRARAGDERPFVLLTGTADEADLGDSRSLLVDAYLTKPVGTEALRTVLQRLLEPTTV